VAEVALVDLTESCWKRCSGSCVPVRRGGICRGSTARGGARGEAMECAASLDVLKVRRLIEQPRYERGIELLEAVVAMLTKMITVESST